MRENKVELQESYVGHKNNLKIKGLAENITHIGESS